MPESDQSLPAQDVPRPSKKKRSSRLESGLPLSEYARAVMRIHFDELLINEPGTRLGEDIEALHDMRVATRRLRAAFEVFSPAFRQRETRSLLRELRDARLALGPVRDLDVLIENAQLHQQETGVNLQLLIDDWQSQRQAARRVMLAYLDSPAYEAFKTDFTEFLNTPGAAARRFQTAEPFPQVTWQVAPLLIYQRYIAVLACENILPEATPEQLHDLRVRFKKLRYTVEFLRDILGKPAGEFIQELKIMQDHLGHLNDAHLSCDLVSALLTRLQTESQSLPIGLRPDLGGIFAYLSHLHNLRRQLAETFPQAWQNFNRPQVRQSLALALSEL